MAARNLRLVSPNSHGADVKTLQAALNNRLTARGKPKIKADGVYGTATAAAVRSVSYFLGADDSTLDKGATIGIQRIIEHPSTRTPAQLSRAKSRAKYQDTINKGPDALIKWARSKDGVHETGDTNTGPQVDIWEKEFGLHGEPWCGCFAGYGLRKIAGVPVAVGVVYTPNIKTYAQNGTGGFVSWHPWSDRKHGDLILFDFGGPIIEHVGIYDANGETIEGNTSQDEHGSQNNGGSVAIKKRTSGIAGCARPRY